MAKAVMLRNPQTGIVKKGLYGFSWTTFFFGGLPAMFRGDWLMGLILVVLQFLTWGISGLIAAFVYNKHYTTKLIERGYRFADTEAVNAMARARLGITQTAELAATAN
ncbi:MAG TPA: hypothetical protein VGD08_12915 [Stellaceae bacterium]